MNPWLKALVVFADGTMGSVDVLRAAKTTAYSRPGTSSKQAVTTHLVLDGKAPDGGRIFRELSWDAEGHVQVAGYVLAVVHE